MNEDCSDTRINAQCAIDIQLHQLHDALISEKSMSASHNWTVRKIVSENHWMEARQKLLDCSLASDRVFSVSCDHCRVNAAVIRCKDCLPKPHYCDNCDVSTHQYLVLHNRECFFYLFFKPIPPSNVIKNINGQHTLCEQACLLPIQQPQNICSCVAQNMSVSAGRLVHLININGRHDLSLPVWRCITCHKTWTPELQDLIQSGYWPGSFAFQTIYQIDLFTSFEQFKVTAPGLSRQAFVNMLENRSRTFGRIDTICGKTFQKAFLEWTYCRHEKEKLSGVDHFLCPACVPDAVAVSADGNRKLYRFNKAKEVEEQPFYEGIFIAKDEDVAAFVDFIQQNTNPVKGRGTCGQSTWAAARETSKKSSNKLDEEGLEVAVCRHNILLKGLNMKRGEIFASPMFLQNEVATKTNCRFFCTDIMCRYWPYLQKVAQAVPRLQPLTEMKPFLSVMHAKGHSTSCEVQWSGKNQTGAGTTIGEEVEQVNSFLSRVALTTKYMSKAARVDMITLHAKGWNERKRKNLHIYLFKRYIKTGQKMKEAKEDVEAVQAVLAKSKIELQQWVCDVKQWATQVPDGSRTDDPVGLQHQIEGLYLGIQQKKRDLYWLTDRNKQRHKVRRRIVEEKKKLSDAISKYNSLPTSTKALNSADDLLAAETPIWPWEMVGDASLAMKKKVFDKLMQVQRLEEEEAILVEEMKRHWDHICRRVKDLNDQTDALSDGLTTKRLSEDAYCGLLCLLRKQLHDLKTEKQRVKEVYHRLVTGWDSLDVLEEDDCGDYESMSTDSYESADEDSVDPHF
ncbi:hypothetical protein PO909_022202 [Leuciscus waleckii]